MADQKKDEKLKELIESIENVTDDPEYKEALKSIRGFGGRIAISNKFSVEIILDEIIEFHRKLKNKRPDLAEILDSEIKALVSEIFIKREGQELILD